MTTILGVFSQDTNISQNTVIQYSLQLRRNHNTVNIENDSERNINIIGASLQDTQLSHRIQSTTKQE